MSKDEKPPDYPRNPKIECIEENAFFRDDKPEEPPPGKTTKICRPFITLKNGKKIFAAAYGKQAFCFWV